MIPSEKVSIRNPRERGIAVLLAALMAFFLIGSVGLSVDAGLAYLVKGRLSAAVDAASLGAARGLTLGEDENTARVAATASATRFFKANFPDNYMGTNPSLTTIAPAFTIVTAGGAPTGVLKVEVTGTVTAPTYFMKMFSVANMRISATGSASRRTLVMMLVLDLSGSMGGRATPGVIPTSVSSTTSSCDAMVYGASKFLEYFSPYDYVGAITFGFDASEIYAPSKNFKLSNTSGLNHQLKNITCNGWTNTAPSINMAWNSIRNVGLRLAMNEVVLFTDGMPNVVTGNFPLRVQRDTRYGPAKEYGRVNGVTVPPVDNPTNAPLFFRDRNDPYSPSTYDLATNITPTLNAPYTAAQQAQINAGVLPRYGDSRFLPLTNAQFTAHVNLGATTRRAFGWYLETAAGPYRRKWIQDPAAPAGNYFNCISTNTNIDVLNRGVTWMCVDMPLPSLQTSPPTAYGGIAAAGGSGGNPSFNPRFGPRSSTWFSAYAGETKGSFPSGFFSVEQNGNVATTQSIAFIPDLDAKFNSNLGFRTNWVYNVNEGCAPPGTTLPNGSNDRCKNRGGLWSDYPSVGLGTNKYTVGPYADQIRADLPNSYPAAAMNSAVSAAFRAKSDTDYNIRFDTVYLIGGEDNVDREFLQIIANVDVFKPTIFDGANAMTQGLNPWYNPLHQKGLWFYTTNPADLANLFAQIAGSLLRLSS